MKSAQRLLPLLAGLCLATAAAAQDDLPTYACTKTATPPTIDGNAGDPAWDQAEATALFDVEDRARQAQHSRPTRAKMLWDDDNLYFLFEMEDADVWSTFTNRDDQIWQEEVVEIFIDPDGDGLDYAEIEVNPLNVVFDLLLSRPWSDGGRGFAQWNPTFSSAVTVDGSVNDDSDTDSGWTVEVALPWEALATDIRNVANGKSLPPQMGDEWRLNLYRFERLRQNGAVATAEASAWSTVGVVDFHRPDRFGILSFVDAPTAVGADSWGRVKGQVKSRQ